MTFSDVPAGGVLARLVRLPLRLLPPRAVVPVVQGPLRGARWIVGSGNHGFWLGTFERDKMIAFAAAVHPGDVVYDVGAHAGLYTLLASRYAGPAGRVFAFEPAAANLANLNRHCVLNRASNVQIVEAAASDVDGLLSFAAGPSSAMGRLSDDGALTVRSVSLDRLVLGDGQPAPRVIKMDIEGGELRALGGAREVLRLSRPTIFLATHGAEVHAECCTLLRSLGYGLYSLDHRPLESTDEVLAKPLAASSGVRGSGV